MIFISNKDAAQREVPDGTSQRAVIPRWSSGGRALRIVIDASVVLKWIPGKNEIDVEKAVEIFKAMMKDKLEVYAPTFLLIEVLNILIRKRKLRRDIILESMQKLSSGKIKFIDLDISGLDQIEEMMCKFGLTAYDAIYLNLAKEKGCRLLTVDQELLKIRKLTVSIKELIF